MTRLAPYHRPSRPPTGPLTERLAVDERLRIEDFDHRDQLEVGVLHFPDDLLVWRELEDLRLGGHAAVAGPVGDDGVAVSQALHAGSETEGVSWDIFLADFPDDLVLRIDLDDAVSVAAGDQRVQT